MLDKGQKQSSTLSCDSSYYCESNVTQLTQIKELPIKSLAFTIRMRWFHRHILGSRDVSWISSTSGSLVHNTQQLSNGGVAVSIADRYIVKIPAHLHIQAWPLIFATFFNLSSCFQLEMSIWRLSFQLIP